MKKISAGMAVLAFAGFTGLSMAPASAVPFQNCDAAKAVGVYNIQAGDSRYGVHLDRNRDGVGCENSSYALTPVDTVPGTVPPVTTTPVAPETTSWAYDNCSAAAAEGRYNIPWNDPRYGAHLDRDGDGIGCEQGTNEVETGTDVIIDYVPEHWNTGGQYGQVGQVPVGGADTGVAVEESSSVPGLALGGGLALVAAAGAAVVVRRRGAQA